MTETTLPGKRDLWIRTLRRAPQHALTLLCFPHAGGSASYFARFAGLVPDSVEVLGVQYPGRQDRYAEPMIDNIPELAERVAGVVSRPGPVAFFGHSMGAILAFEVTRRMEAEGGTRPVRIFVSGRRAPSCQRGENVHLRDDQGVLAEVRSLNGTAAHLFDDEELIAMVLPAIRNDYRAIETYRCVPGATVECPVSAFVGDADPKTTQAEAGAWAGHTTGGFDMEVFSGGHFYVESQWGRVAAELARRLP